MPGRARGLLLLKSLLYRPDHGVGILIGVQCMICFTILSIFLHGSGFVFLYKEINSSCSASMTNHTVINHMFAMLALMKPNSWDLGFLFADRGCEFCGSSTKEANQAEVFSC